MSDDPVEVVVESPWPNIKWVSCGDDVFIVVHDGAWLTFGKEEGAGALPIAQIDNIRRCLDRIEQLAD